MTIRGATILQGGRQKAYRPLALDERIAAIEAGLAAYRRGDYFEAHELLEPAWMGTDRLPEREFVQGLIKLAAAYVHAVRGNSAGIAKNLRGARERLAASLAQTAADLPGPLTQVDRVALMAAIDERLAGLAAGAKPIAAPSLPIAGGPR